METNKNNGMCKYYTSHIKTLQHLIHAYYEICEDIGQPSGSFLHIMLDDDNYDDDDIAFCLSECIKHPDIETSGLGKLICEEFIKLSVPERLLFKYLIDCDFICIYGYGCTECDIQKYHKSK